MANYARARQRDEFGGTNWGAAFFGWLVAVGLGALLTALLSAAGTALALSEFETVGQASNNAETVGIVGGILIILVGLIAYFAGGYVAGRMSRFDGGRQGLGVWAWGLLVAIAVAALAAIGGSKYKALHALNLPRLPVDSGTPTTGGHIALVLSLAGAVRPALLGRQ